MAAEGVRKEIRRTIYLAGQPLFREGQWSREMVFTSPY